MERVKVVSVMLKLLPLSLQRVIFSGTLSTHFVRTSASPTKVGWLSWSLVTTTSTPGLPSPRATLRTHCPAGSSWGTMRQEWTRLWWRPSAIWTAAVGLHRLLVCAQPRREGWSSWRMGTSSVSGYKTFHWWTSRTEPQPLGCTNCRTPIWARGWT